MSEPTDDTKDTGDTGVLPVFGGGGVMPGLDLQDGRRLADLLDEATPLDALR